MVLGEMYKLNQYLIFYKAFNLKLKKRGRLNMSLCSWRDPTYFIRESQLFTHPYSEMFCDLLDSMSDLEEHWKGYNIQE